MQKIARAEILPLPEYETIRERFRARIIEHKRPRRVSLGPIMSGVFEDRDTALYQIQEMLRTERITREDAVLHEIQTYNDLVPGPSELSATVFLEIEDKAVREKTLVDLAGLEACFRLEVDGVRIPATSESRGVLPDRTTTVHYLKFPLDEQSAKKLASGKGAWSFVVDHPKYRHVAELPPQTVVSLAGDLS